MPPKAIFALADRNPPLLLPAHDKCNGDQSPLDTLIGQLVGLLHGSAPEEKNRRLDVGLLRDESGRVTAGVRDIPLMAIVFRWVRYFHAALYQEFLADRSGAVFLPLPAGDFVNGRLVYEEMHPSRPHLTHIFKQQMKAGLVDGLTCYNDKCVYRCAWLNFDNGAPFCLFALRLYQWEELGDPGYAGHMGCIGWYASEIPATATRGTRLEVPASNLAPLDPFAP